MPVLRLDGLGGGTSGLCGRQPDAVADGEFIVARAKVLTGSGLERRMPQRGAAAVPLGWGGANGTRTRNPLLAKQVRYLLRHGPSVTICPSGRNSRRCARVRYQASTLSVCTVCAIRFAAPFTASEQPYRPGGRTRRCDRYGRMAQQLGHHRDIGTGGQHQARGAVPQPVEGQRRRVLLVPLAGASGTAG